MKTLEALNIVEKMVEKSELLKIEDQSNLIIEIKKFRNEYRLNKNIIEKEEYNSNHLEVIDYIIIAQDQEILIKKIGCKIIKENFKKINENSKLYYFNIKIEKINSIMNNFKNEILVSFYYKSNTRYFKILEDLETIQLDYFKKVNYKSCL